jgi:hypothetical protein
MTKENVEKICPGYGLEPKFCSQLIGRASFVVMEFVSPLSIDSIDLE